MPVTLVFGDVHGEAGKLAGIIYRAIEKYGDVDFYSVGDLVDRGPESYGVLDLCVKHKVKGVIGNHDEWLMYVATDKVLEGFALKSIMGGRATCRSYGLDMPEHRLVGKHELAELGAELYQHMPMSHRLWLRELVPARCLTVQGRSYVLSHAGITRGTAELVGGSDRPHTEIVDDIMASHRDKLWWSFPDVRPASNNLHRFHDATQIFGHTAIAAPIVVPDHYIALDTGSGTCDPHTLSGYVVETGEWFEAR